MNRIVKNLWPVSIIMIAATLAGFSLRPGAHSFQVFIDERMVIDHYVDRNWNAPTVQLGSKDKKIEVRYSECGRTVSGRSLTAKDKSNKVLKVWKFDGSTSGLKDAMTIPSEEIRMLANNSGNAVQIYYSSNDFAEGLRIFSVALGSSTVASGN